MTDQLYVIRQSDGETFIDAMTKNELFDFLSDITGGDCETIDFDDIEEKNGWTHIGFTRMRFFKGKEVSVEPKTLATDIEVLDND